MKRILVVEDDDLMEMFYKRLFQQYADEFSFRIERTAVAAIKRLSGGKIDLVILDWDLPRISGLDLLKALRANTATKSLRVMVVSGRVRNEDIARALEGGADDYLSKPFAVEVLLARVRSLMRR